MKLIAVTRDDRGDAGSDNTDEMIEQAEEPDPEPEDEEEEEDDD